MSHEGYAISPTRAVHLAHGYVCTVCEYLIIGSYADSGFGNRNLKLHQGKHRELYFAILCVHGHTAQKNVSAPGQHNKGKGLDESRRCRFH